MTRKETTANHERPWINAATGHASLRAELPRGDASCSEQDVALRQIVESLPVAVWLQDIRTGEILYVNAAYETLWGRSVATLYRDGMSFLDAVHPEDRGTLSLVFLGQTGLGAQGEFRIVRPDGQILWVECRTSLIEDASGTVSRLAVIVEEITQRKEKAAIVEGHLKELESRNIELDAFAHTTAHNLRSALGLILGNAMLLDTLAAHRLEAVDLECLHDMVQAAEKAKQIIEDLLLLSTVGHGGPLCEPLQMGRIVENALERLQPWVARTGAYISLPDVWPTALGYAPWVEEVWVNYLDNALKYGGLRPRIELGSLALGDGKVRFYVRDHGPGIAEPDLARLFQPFTRLASPDTEGSGLGLAIVKRIMARLGGEAVAESTAGAGSRFSFTLPAL